MVRLYLLAAFGLCGLGSVICDPNIVLNPPGAKSSAVYQQIFGEDAPVLSRAANLELLKTEAKNLAGSTVMTDRIRLVMINKFIEFADISQENCDHLKNINWYIEHIDEKHGNIISFLDNIEQEQYNLCYGPQHDAVPMSDSDSETYRKIFASTAPVLKPEQTLRLLNTEALRLSADTNPSDTDKTKRALIEGCIGVARVSKDNCDSLDDIGWLVANIGAKKHPNIRAFLDHYQKEQKAIC